MQNYKIHDLIQRDISSIVQIPSNFQSTNISLMKYQSSIIGQSSFEIQNNEPQPAAIKLIINFETGETTIKDEPTKKEVEVSNNNQTENSNVDLRDMKESLNNTLAEFSISTTNLQTQSNQQQIQKPQPHYQTTQQIQGTFTRQFEQQKMTENEQPKKIIEVDQAQEQQDDVFQQFENAVPDPRNFQKVGQKTQMPKIPNKYKKGQKNDRCGCKQTCIRSKCDCLKKQRKCRHGCVCQRKNHTCNNPRNKEDNSVNKNNNNNTNKNNKTNNKNNNSSNINNSNQKNNNNNNGNRNNYNNNNKNYLNNNNYKNKNNKNSATKNIRKYKTNQKNR